MIKDPGLFFTYFRLFLIYKKKRFHQGVFSILNKKFVFVDSASFVFMYLDIFINKSYKFKTEKPNPVIIDCGANIGLSVLYFKTLYPDAIVRAFEPDAKIFKVLEDNCNKFCLKNVELFNKGVWTNNEEVSFLSDGADGGKIVKNFDSNELSKLKMVHLKDLLEKEKEIDLLKIDIEGAESEVISDCSESLQGVKFLFVEYHSSASEEQKLDDLLGVLKKAGFRYYINSVNFTPKNYFLDRTPNNGFDLQLNIYACR